MNKRYTEEQIIKAIKRHDSGFKGDEICRVSGIKQALGCQTRPVSKLQGSGDQKLTFPQSLRH